MRPMTTYLTWEKLGEGRGVTRKERGLPPGAHNGYGLLLPLSCPSTDYRRIVDMYEFPILKSFYNTEKYVITSVCPY